MSITTTAKLREYAKTITIGATVSSSLCFYIAYRAHDRRALSMDEVAAARDFLAQIATPKPKFSTTHLHHHIHNLNKFGVAVMKDTLSPPELLEWNRKTKAAFENTDGRNHNIAWNAGRAHCIISKRSVYYEDVKKIGGNDIPTDNETNASTKPSENKNWFSHIGKRKKRNETSDHRTYEYGLVPPKVSLQQIVKMYFQQHNISRYELTDVQFLNAYPDKSINQIWHMDNKFKGLTAIIALKNVRDNGPTELILGSHSPEYSLWSKYLMALKSYLGVVCDSTEEEGETESIPNQPLLACIDAGDTILYDARIFHRGRGNNSTATKDTDRPVLVLRWDASRTPPPGTGLIITTANIYWGKVLYAGLYLLEKIKGCNK